MHHSLRDVKENPLAIPLQVPGVLLDQGFFGGAERQRSLG